MNATETPATTGGGSPLTSPRNASIRLPRGVHLIRFRPGHIVDFSVDVWRMRWEMLKLAPKVLSGELDAGRQLDRAVRASIDTELQRRSGRPLSSEWARTRKPAR